MALTRQPTITINSVCTPEQLAEVQALSSALQADLYRLGVAFSVRAQHDPPPRPTMTLEEAQRDPQGFLVGFAETEHSVHFDPELARRQRELLDEQMAEPLWPGSRRHRLMGRSIDLPADLTEAQFHE